MVKNMTDLSKNCELGITPSMSPSPVKNCNSRHHNGLEETVDQFENEVAFELLENLPESAPSFNLPEIYSKLEDTSTSVDSRLQLLEDLKDHLRQGHISFSDLAACHVHLCIEQVNRFNRRPGLGLLQNNEKLLVPVLTFLQEGLLMNDKFLLKLALKSLLLSCLTKLVLTFAERTDLMTKRVARLCFLETVLGKSVVVDPSECLQSILDVPTIPECLIATNISKEVRMQHLYDCPCLDCKEIKEKLPMPSNPLQLCSGDIGTLMYPVRSLSMHKAAICPVPQYWKLLESRSQKIGSDIDHLVKRSEMKDNKQYEHGHRNRLNHMFAPGQQVAVPTESVTFIDYERTSLDKLPMYVRGFVIGHCALRIGNPHIAIWIPDYAAKGLCLPDQLFVLPEFSSIRSCLSLVFIGSACPPTPLDAVTIAIELIHLLLQKNANLDSVRSLLEDKGPWKCVQLIRFISGDAKVKFLSIINKLTKACERKSRSVVVCCLHNTLADWLAWKVYTQPISQFELETVIDGLIQSIPRIDARKWPQRVLLLQSLHALMRDCSDDILKMLNTCKQMLVWDQNQNESHNKFSHHMRHEGRPNHDHHQVGRNVGSKQKFVVSDNKFDDTEGDPCQYTIGRKPRHGEIWYQCSSVTLSMRTPDSTENVDCAAVLQASIPVMLRDVMYLDVKQKKKCEVLQVANLSNVRQLMLARIMCGMLNTGGGRVFIGLGDHGLIQGVHATRPERDSFSQGVLDVATHSLEPRLMPFNFQLERRIVLKSRDHVPDGEWSLFVFIIHVYPLPETKYMVLPDKQSFIRQEDGSTVVYADGEKLNSKVEQQVENS